MSDSASPREEGLFWIVKAEQHLLAARLLLERGGPAAFACFACQQSAEIALKALLAAQGLPPPRTHDLVELHRRLPEHARPVEVHVEALARWTDYAVAPRYPGFPDERAELELPAMVDGVTRLCAAARALIERFP